MPERASSFVRKTQILQFCLLASDIVWRGRTPFFAINSNHFGKVWEFTYKTKDFNGGGDLVEMNKTIRRNGPTRKIFRKYIHELLQERLLTQIKTKDERSKFYSITPLGICHLIKSAEGDDRIKYPWPERMFVIGVLATFASPNVKPYGSLIFEGQKFISKNNDMWTDLTEWLDITLRHQIVHVFSNIDFFERNFRFYITTGYNLEHKIKIASFNLESDEFIQVIELDKNSSSIKSFYSDLDYKPLILDNEQFHHYLSNLMLSSLIFDSALARFDTDTALLRKGSVGKRRRESIIKEAYDKMSQYPEYFKNICVLFSKHAENMVNRQYILTSEFRDALNRTQFS